MPAERCHGGRLEQPRARFAIERSEVDGKWQLRLRQKAATTSGDMPIKEIRLSGGAFVDTVEIEKTSGDLDRFDV